VHEVGFTLPREFWQEVNWQCLNYSEAPDLTSKSIAAAINARV